MDFSQFRAVYPRIRCKILHMIQARKKHAGSVRTQASTIFPPTPHLTAEKRLDAPTPMMVDEMTWVVESGRPILDATSMTVAAAVSAANPWMGLN